MKKLFLILINITLLLIITITVYYLVVQKNVLFAETNNFFNRQKTLAIDIPEVVKEIKREKPAEIEIKALYLTAYSGSSQTKIDQMIAFVKNSEINAFVIDIKDYSGTIAYDSQIEIINQLEIDRNLIKNIPALIEKLHQNDIYVIARQTVFQDPELTKKKPEWAVKNTQTGGIWYDYKGLSWADPTNEKVWEYNLNIAKEAIELGFDEINFDYIRFPSDGPMKAMGFANLADRPKHAVMKEFFSYLYENLKDEPAYISGDLFGFTTERDDDMNIGQVLEDAVLYFDYVCPMVYPSHYPSGYLNLTNPAANPYEVISHSIAKGIESMTTVTEPRAKIRPWLQAFNMGAIYTPTMIDLQIQASSENGGYGYLLWNARNVYNYVPR
jgi:hypothetical protein